MATEFKYIVTDKGVKIKEYIGKDKEVVIPSEIDGMPVTSIGGCSFSSSDILPPPTLRLEAGASRSSTAACTVSAS